MDSGSESRPRVPDRDGSSLQTAGVVRGEVAPSAGREPPPLPRRIGSGWCCWCPAGSGASWCSSARSGAGLAAATDRDRDARSGRPDGLPVGAARDAHGPARRDAVRPGPAGAIIDQGLVIIRRLWEAGLAHRDIKPANLLVRDGRLYLIDVFFTEVRPSPWRQG